MVKRYLESLGVSLDVLMGGGWWSRLPWLLPPPLPFPFVAKGERAMHCLLCACNILSVYSLLAFRMYLRVICRRE